MKKQSSAKKRINSKEKGNRAERELVKKFAKWWDSKFYRTPGSGSFATRGYNLPEGVDLSGDVVTTDSSFPFCVESKNFEGWHLEQLLTSDKCGLKAYWQQTVSETPDHKLPLLVFTRNHQPHFIMMREEDDLLNGECMIVQMSLEDGEKDICVIYLLKDLLESDKELWKKPKKRKTIREM